MQIYYEDEDIIVCEKPYGISSQSSGGENMVDILSDLCKCEIYPIHRLDITTDGIMIYAKNRHSAAFFSNSSPEKLFEKEYLCVVHGVTEPTGEMTDLLWHDRIKNKTFVVNSTRAGVKEAKLAFWTLETNLEKSLSLVRVKLFTGRTHQIRAQLANASHPLYADGKYGAKDNGKIALHSYKITFTHPTSKKEMTFKSLPSDEIFNLFDMKSL